MTNAREVVDALEKAAVQKKKERDEYTTRLNDIGDEIRSPGNVTLTGKYRRHTSPRRQNFLFLLKNPHALALTLITADTARVLKNVPDLWRELTASLQPAHKNTALHHEDDNTTLVYETAYVSDAVKDRLYAVEQEWHTHQQRRDALHREGQHGPLAQDYYLHRLQTAFGIHVHPQTNELAFSAKAVSSLEADIGTLGGTHPVTIYTAVPLSSLRGIHVKAADPNTADTVKVAASEEANKTQTATVTLRPGLHLH